MQHEILIAGFGGQGVMFAGQLIAYAAMEEDYQVTWIPSYGPEMRGGTAHCTTVISKTLIGASVVKHPEIGIVFNNPSYEIYESVIASGGLLAVNSSLIKARSERHDMTCLAIPATKIADQLGSIRLTNMVMLGAVLAQRPILSIESVKRALELHSHHKELLQQNYAALESGAEFVAELVARELVAL